MVEFNQWFKNITRNEPYDFQIRFATDSTLPQLVRIPTGCGKTDMVLLGWLWRRIASGNKQLRETTPRRLVYCLPMRVLVEQTYDLACQYTKALGIKTYKLMGGETDDDYIRHPEEDCVIVGTQDMLLSRALNRGYAASRYRWPMDFGLLNNDCLWVMDEVQLMDAGLATSTQLDGFRQKLSTFKTVQSVWMSATLEMDWLDTVDFDRSKLLNPLELRDNDFENKELYKRFHSSKHLHKLDLTIGDAKKIAGEIVSIHQNMQQIEAIRTLVVMNTVDRAIDVYKEVKNLTRNQSIKSILIHSRYRPQDREKKIHELLAEPKDGGTIAITTQVIEAGVDISSNVLFTEIAPWSSLVQRFGRCNRRGEYNESGGGHIYLINLSEDEKEQKKNARPYDLADLKNSQKLINYVNNVDPSSLKQLQDVHSQEYRDAMRLEHTHVIRYKDLLDLFDTTPDLAGNDIDISRFIRSGEELDVHVFWRDWPVKEKLDPNQDYAKAPHRDELCPVPVYQFEDFLKNKGDSVWRWDSLDQKWIKADRNSVYPGQTYLIRCNAGGYDPEIGWNAKSKESVNTVAISLEQKQEGYSDDYYSITAWVTISQHTDDVVKYVKEFIEALGIEGEWKESLLWAARWHDRGKAHRIFQEAIKNRPEPWNNNNDLAKAPEGFWGRYQRKHFRHELASALAMRQSNFSPLAVYLTAAHHGKVRLSIRSLPGEIPPENPQKLFARGIYDGDELPSTNLGDGIIADSIVLSLECMQLGRSKNNEPSWIEQMLKLRDEVGLFKLAFLEAVFRAADWRASKEDQNNA